MNKPTPSSSMTNNWRMMNTPQINGNSSWKANNRSVIISKTHLKQQIIPQICNKIS